MEIREWAIAILSATDIDSKLLQPKELTDNEPGPPLRWDTPSRPPGMEFHKRPSGQKLPPFHEHKEADKRAICLHRFAGHELLAVELIAFALLAFPEAPVNLRKGLAHALKEEQEHVALYIERMGVFGLQFGDLPLFKHFWAHTPHVHDILSFISMMNLTFEQANLDFAPMYGTSFLRYGDEESAALMGKILSDEIRHVQLGWRWLQRLKHPDQSAWDAWIHALPELIGPKRAKGFLVHEEHRRAAGLSDEWIERIKVS
ncbi:MAG: hypothetical protein CMO81_01665 [Waddliaceae bacterium]|nr:hypothetical protein [Waddliaceae bacterium]